jgi:UDP-GlcNAc:undecaprenyl-phosphate/decaprenyl-phosphate GlcNAc-1-phosphate transferase
VSHVLLATIAAALSFAVTPAVRRLAIAVHAIDHPGRRRVHASPVPRLGGLAVLAAALATAALGAFVGVDVVGRLVASGWRLDWLLGGILLAVATGVVDDVRGLAPLPKLLLIVAAAAVAVAGGYGLRGFTEPFTGTYVEFGPLGGLATVSWIVVVTSAFNLVDGLDGLATGVALIASVTLLAVSHVEGRADVALLWAVLAGALVGFLPYNFFPASIFLGDSGSYLLGYLLAVLAVQSLEKGATVVAVLVPVLALGLPMTELVSTVVRRSTAWGAGAILRADRGHIHHDLLRRGLTHRGAVLTLYAVCAALGALACLSVVVQGRTSALVVGVGAIATYVGIGWLRTRRPPSRAR